MNLRLARILNFVAVVSALVVLPPVLATVTGSLTFAALLVGVPVSILVWRAIWVGSGPAKPMTARQVVHIALAIAIVVASLAPSGAAAAPGSFSEDEERGPLERLWHKLPEPARKVVGGTALIVGTAVACGVTATAVAAPVAGPLCVGGAASLGIGATFDVGAACLGGDCTRSNLVGGGKALFTRGDGSWGFVDLVNFGTPACEAAGSNQATGGDAVFCGMEMMPMVPSLGAVRAANGLRTSTRALDASFDAAKLMTHKPALTAAGRTTLLESQAARPHLQNLINQMPEAMKGLKVKSVDDMLKLSAAKQNQALAKMGVLKGGQLTESGLKLATQSASLRNVSLRNAGELASQKLVVFKKALPEQAFRAKPTFGDALRAWTKPKQSIDTLLPKGQRGARLGAASRTGLRQTTGIGRLSTKLPDDVLKAVGKDGLETTVRIKPGSLRVPWATRAGRATEYVGAAVRLSSVAGRGFYSGAMLPDVPAPCVDCDGDGGGGSGGGGGEETICAEGDWICVLQGLDEENYDSICGHEFDEDEGYLLENEVLVTKEMADHICQFPFEQWENEKDFFECLEDNPEWEGEPTENPACIDLLPDNGTPVACALELTPCNPTPPPGTPPINAVIAKCVAAGVPVEYCQKAFSQGGDFGFNVAKELGLVALPKVDFGKPEFNDLTPDGEAVWRTELKVGPKEGYGCKAGVSLILAKFLGACGYVPQIKSVTVQTSYEKRPPTGADLFTREELVNRTWLDPESDVIRKMGIPAIVEPNENTTVAHRVVVEYYLRTVPNEGESSRLVPTVFRTEGTKDYVAQDLKVEEGETGDDDGDYGTVDGDDDEGCGALCKVSGGLSLQTWLIILGIVVGLAGFVMYRNGSLYRLTKGAIGNKPKGVFDLYQKKGPGAFLSKAVFGKEPQRKLKTEFQREGVPLVVPANKDGTGPDADALKGLLSEDK